MFEALCQHAPSKFTALNFVGPTYLTFETNLLRAIINYLIFSSAERWYFQMCVSRRKLIIKYSFAVSKIPDSVSILFRNIIIDSISFQHFKMLQCDLFPLFVICFDIASTQFLNTLQTLLFWDKPSTFHISNLSLQHLKQGGSFQSPLQNDLKPDAHLLARSFCFSNGPFFFQ